MAHYLLTRDDHPNLTAKVLSAKLEAFRTLHAHRHNIPFTVTITIRGEWPAAYNGDGLFLKYVQVGKAEIISIGREYIWVKWSEDLVGLPSTKEHRVKLPLCPTPDTGFLAIAFTGGES